MLRTLSLIISLTQFLPVTDGRRTVPIVKVKKEIYVNNTVAGKAPWVYVFPGKGRYREELHTVWSHENQVKGYGDSPSEPRRRISYDNGRTWSELAPLAPLMIYPDETFTANAYKYTLSFEE